MVRALQNVALRSRVWVAAANEITVLSVPNNSSTNPLPPDPSPFAGGHSSAPGEFAASAAQPFWGRLVRAVFMLALAVAAHVWLERSPGTRGVPTLASSPVQSGINAVVQTIGKNASVEATAPDGTPGVTVRTELVPVSTIGVEPPTAGPEPMPNPAPPPAPTAGVLAADRRGPRVLEPTPVAERVAASEAAPIEATRRNDEPAPGPELTPLAAARRSLPELPKGMVVNANLPRANPPAERIIRTAPIVEPDRQLVNRVLEQYAAAYERLDAEAAKEVYPSVNDTALRRAFSNLEAQRVTLGACGITISGSDANARCKGEAAYLPRVGSRTLHTAPREWTFDLAKADDGWHIVRATVR